MITVQLNEPDFEYDIHSLVKAFYPQHDVLVKAMPREEFPESVFHLVVNYDRKNHMIDFKFYEREQQEENNIAKEETENTDQSSEESVEQNKKNDVAEEKMTLGGSVLVDFADRKKTKNELKQQLYYLLTLYAGKTLPWGTLTGIRPTKIPMELLEEGKSEDEIRSYMKETYFASDEKIELSLAVAKRELELLSRIDYENGYSLYVGIPFCPSTCLYCSFTSYPLAKWANRMDEYLDALEKEIAFTAEACKHKVLNSVYIGGGTPTTLSAEQMDRLLTMIGSYFGIADEQGRMIYVDEHMNEADAADETQNSMVGVDSENGAAHGNASGSCCESSKMRKQTQLLEFTVEAGRPDSITREKLEVIHKHNISRISINPQTMKEETLRLIGRQHTVQQTIDSFKLAREVGFDNINMDLIVGLPEETIEDVRETMRQLEELDPDNITVHSLAIKRAARLRMQKEQYEDLHIENTAQTIDLTAECCHEMGLEPYYLYRQKNMAGNFENVGYAKPGKAGVYNILIMEEKQTIMALGAGATTKVVFEDGKRIERVGNVKDITNYLDRVDEMVERKRELLKNCGQLI
ncbi:coproporphyrinogen dehydrogenase HemZ [uncultured Eubacterium sp.]|uniref:coproporphyrinogen dehydrogenase HemZ n=1 Tax=uncultured Eubacterium sp. TaxID=165185 RepID=UPI0025F024BC|nr:coproporphyrinogen dehydrogenase HemZ [uncultured Eubacterium sp.]